MKTILSLGVVALVSVSLLPASASAQTLPPSGSADALSAPPVATLTPAEPRAEHKFALLGEVGWNGLAGVGLGFVYHALPQLSFDAAAGMSGTGAKAGVRARYNFLKGEWTPLFGVGFNYGSGTGGKTVEVNSDNNPINLKLKASPFLQVVTGLEYTPGDGGFTFLGTIGYAHLFGDNVEIVSGTPTSTQSTAMDIAYKSGPVVSLAFGYAF